MAVQIVEKETITVTGVRLTRPDVAAILALVTGIADSGTRPVLANVRIEASNDHLTFVATDGFRLTEAVFNAPTHWQGWVLVNAADLAKALSAVKLRKYDTLELGINEDGCYAQSDERQFMPAQEGRYPAYQVIMPRVDKKALLSKDTILEACAVARALQAFDDGYHATMVTIETTEDGGTISVGGSNKGRSDVTWTWESKGQDAGRVTFNPDYLRQLLRSLPSYVTGTTMEWGVGLARRFEMSCETGAITHVMMPMYVSDSREAE